MRTGKGPARTRFRAGAVVAAVTAVVVLVVSAGPARAQDDGHLAASIRRAAQLEAAGRLSDSEAILREILVGDPAAVPALLALERVLRKQGRPEELIPLMEQAVDVEPRSALVQQLRIRTYSAMDRVRDLERAAREWMSTVPRIEIPYREVARVWASRGEYGRAREVLEEGRRRLGRADAMALPMGDLYAALGEYEQAAMEWARAVEPDGRGLAPVQRRLQDLPDGGRGAAGVLVDAVAGPDAPPGRVEAALTVALDLGLGPRTRALVERRLASLEPGARRELLADVARRADELGDTELAFWAYSELIVTTEALRGQDPGAVDPGRLLILRSRRAELALALGDTAAAARGYGALEEAFDVGSPQRRAAAALRIELMADQNVEQALAALETFRERYHAAPELDGLAARVAGALVRQGRRDEAEALLDGVDGPASALLLGRLLLERGESARARGAYLEAVPGLRGAEATRILGLITLLGRVSRPAGAVIGDALRARDAGRTGAAVDRLASGGQGLAPGDIPPLLDFAARLADEAGLSDDARGLRRRIVAEHPGSTEAPAALLALGRDLGASAASRGQAREYLERLIIEYPGSALVPQARRALERLAVGGAA